MLEEPAQRPSPPLKIQKDGTRGALRVAFIVSAFPELSETFVTRQVVGLLDRGHDVRILAYAEAPPGPTHELVERRALRGRVTVIGPDATRAGAGVSLSTATRCLRPSYARAAGGWRALARELAMLSALGPFDVVHCHFGNVGLRFAVAACVWRAPLVVSFYGYDASSYPRARGDGVYAPLFARADAITSLSAHMDARLEVLGCPPSLLRRVPLSVDPGVDASRAPRAGAASGTVRLLTVARLVEKKGIEHALRAVAALRGEFPALRYDVIGDGPLRAPLESLAATLGIADRVHFLGARSEGDVRAAMRDADLFLLPSVTAPDGDEEGTPTALLEAAWARLPVLATRHAGIPEIVRDGESGVLVVEGDPEALAAAMRALLRDPARWPALGDAGHRLVAESHTMPAVAARLEAIYLELLARRAHGTAANGGAR